MLPLLPALIAQYISIFIAYLIRFTNLIIIENIVGITTATYSPVMPTLDRPLMHNNWE